MLDRPADKGVSLEYRNALLDGIHRGEGEVEIGAGQEVGEALEVGERLLRIDHLRHVVAFGRLVFFPRTRAEM